MSEKWIIKKDINSDLRKNTVVEETNVLHSSVVNLNKDKKFHFSNGKNFKLQSGQVVKILGSKNELLEYIQVYKEPTEVRYFRWKGNVHDDLIPGTLYEESTLRDYDKSIHLDAGLNAFFLKCENKVYKIQGSKFKLASVIEIVVPKKEVNNLPSDILVEKIIHEEKYIGPMGPQGPRGLPGEDGPMGPIGPVGPQGPVGEEGVPGPTGKDGLDGSPGPIGPIGPVGPTGPQGIPGEAAERGDPGPIGPTGPVGATGPKGEKGDQGPQGLPGEVAQKGEQGDRGEKGEPGEKGERGQRGPAGPIGPMGPLGPTGEIGPAGPKGPRGPKGSKGDTGDSPIIAAKYPLVFDEDKGLFTIDKKFFEKLLSNGQVNSQLMNKFVNAASSGGGAVGIQDGNSNTLLTRSVDDLIFQGSGVTLAQEGKNVRVTISGSGEGAAGIGSVGIDGGETFGNTEELLFKSLTPGLTLTASQDGTSTLITLDAYDIAARIGTDIDDQYIYESGSIFSIGSVTSQGELKHYTNFSPNQLHIHKAGISAGDYRYTLSAVVQDINTNGQSEIRVVFGDSPDRVFLVSNGAYDGTKYTFDIDNSPSTAGSGKSTSLYGYIRPGISDKLTATEFFRFPDGTTAESIVTSFNGQTGDVTFNDYVSSFNGKTGDITDADILKISINAQTGVLWGGYLTAEFGGTTFSVSSGIGQIVGLTGGPSGITADRTEVTWGDFTNQTITGLTTDKFTRVYIDANGDIQQQAANFDVDDYEESIVIGTISHINQTDINQVIPKQGVAYNTSYRILELLDIFGPIKASGLVITPNGSNLQLNRSAGEGYRIGSNYQNVWDRPDRTQISADTPASFSRIHRDGSGDYIFDTNGGSYYSVIDPTKYDDNSGTLQTVNNNNWTVQRLFLFPDNPEDIMTYYGIEVYNSLSDAFEAIQVEQFEEATITSQNAIFLGWLVVRGGATDLSTLDDATILQAGLARGTAGGGGAGPAGADGATGATGATGPVGDYVESFNGQTGAIEGVFSVNGETGDVTVSGGGGGTYSVAFFLDGDGAPISLGHKVDALRQIPVDSTLTYAEIYSQDGAAVGSGNFIVNLAWVDDLEQALSGVTGSATVINLSGVSNNLSLTPPKTGTNYYHSGVPTTPPSVTGGNWVYPIVTANTSQTKIQLFMSFVPS
jgi:hypothetical protein